jgi:hypothetical protein
LYFICNSIFSSHILSRYSFMVLCVPVFIFTFGLYFYLRSCVVVISLSVHIFPFDSFIILLINSFVIHGFLAQLSLFPIKFWTHFSSYCSTALPHPIAQSVSSRVSYFVLLSISLLQIPSCFSFLESWFS